MRSDSIDDIEAAYFSGEIIAPAEWPAIAKALARGGKTDCEQADRFASLAALSGSERVETYLDIFCTGGYARTAQVHRVEGRSGMRRLVERLSAEQQRVCALLRRRRAVFSRDRSAALVTVAHEVLTRYDKEKKRRGLLDYDDLIDKALALLSEFGAAWVHYKLDLGIDHVLVDEAQDTSHKQWDIVRRLTAEFTAGAGARSVTRTMFAVGDEKQSIYSFQQAAPKEFDNMRRYFQSAHENSGLKFVESRFEYSFRSGEAILEAVDKVFASADMAASVSASDTGGFPPHNALPGAAPSMVELWELEQPDERDDSKEGWDAPFDTVSETSSRVKLARRIARTVRRMVDEKTTSYGDVLILVRQRGELFGAIIRALKNQDVEVAGADRLMLTEHIAVMDLMALADALLLPQDDLSLATVLRSPLFGFEDRDLYDLAYDRGRNSLRAALARKAGDSPLFAKAAGQLNALEQAARREPPFSFYARLLGEGGARRRFLARLGLEANDAIDEFLNVALEYERRETPSLQGFLTWLRDARAEVKRDMEIRRNEVRVMTVHGAKGLEAPIVILADTITPPVIKPPRLLQLADGAIVWAGRKADDVEQVATARAHANSETEDEYRRLLYVAMTRAAGRLIICGAEGFNRPPKTCWYNLVHEPLKPLLVEEEDGGDKVWRFRKPPRRGACANAGCGAGGERHAARLSALVARARSCPSAAHAMAVAVLGFRRRNRPHLCAYGGLDRRAPQGAATRPHCASADAVAARHSGSRTQGGDRALSQKRRGGFFIGRTNGDGAASACHSQRSEFRRSVRAGKPRRGADCRPHRSRWRSADRRIGPSGPVGGDARFGPDRRLQDRPRRAAPGGGDCTAVCRPARAVSQRTFAHLPESNDSRGTPLYRRPAPDRRSRRGDGCGTGGNHGANRAPSHGPVSLP